MSDTATWRTRDAFTESRPLRVQGYGLTETCGASLIANPYDVTQQSTVGVPVAGLLMRLESIPDMGYDAQADPPRGELLLKGPGVFAAFHKQPELTDEVKGARPALCVNRVGNVRGLLCNTTAQFSNSLHTECMVREAVSVIQ